MRGLSVSCVSQDFAGVGRGCEQPGISNDESFSQMQAGELDTYSMRWSCWM